MTAKQIIPRSEHCISRAKISGNALKVLYRLKENGFSAYLVGGSVRDLLLGREPKDFDIATNALPDQVRELFRNSRLIGKRFRLAHIQFGSELIEVATFRAATQTSDAERSHSERGMILRDNVYGTLEEDVWRRDFTINALYYNIADFSVVDFVNGVEDLNAGVLRLIGEPEQRYIEDPVRMLRAVRFMAKLSVGIHPATEAPLLTHSQLLAEVSISRLFEEVLKLFHGGFAAKTFYLLRKYQLFEYLFPATHRVLTKPENEFYLDQIQIALKNTDDRIAEDKPVNPSFLFSVLLWPAMQSYYQATLAAGCSEIQAYEVAIETVLKEQVKSITIPRRFSSQMIEIWKIQQRFEKRQGKRAFRLFQHKRFRAAYDFLAIRSEVEKELLPLKTWWEKFQEADDEQRKAMVRKLSQTPRKRKNKND